MQATAPSADSWQSALDLSSTQPEEFHCHDIRCRVQSSGDSPSVGCWQPHSLHNTASVSAHAPHQYSYCDSSVSSDRVLNQYMSPTPQTSRGIKSIRGSSSQPHAHTKHDTKDAADWKTIKKPQRRASDSFVVDYWLKRVEASRISAAGNSTEADSPGTCQPEFALISGAKAVSEDPNPVRDNRHNEPRRALPTISIANLCASEPAESKNDTAFDSNVTRRLHWMFGPSSNLGTLPHYHW